MDNEELDGVKFSEFPSQTPVNADEVVGLHSGDNARFSIANIVAAVRNGLANIFVPKTDVGVADGVASLDSTGKVPGTQLDLSGKQSTITASGILKGDGAGGVSAATAGTDYQAPLTAGTDYATPTQLADKANQSQLAYVETGTTASQNYTAGQYISLNGLLYTADTAIASGATFYTSGGNKNLTECVGGGFNSLRDELDYEDISQYVYIQQYNGQDRCSISKLIARKYKNGRVTFYAEGTILVTLTGTQWTIMRIRSQAGVAPLSYVAGTGTYNYLPCFSRIDNSTEPYVELSHNGTSPGKPFEMLVEYWI